MATIEIAPDLALPEDEISYVASRSGGPGGQNVNKLATRMTLRFDLAGSPSLTPAQRERVASRLATRINRAGFLQVTAQRHRTQAANREAALERFVELLRAALQPDTERVPTRVPPAVRRRRLSEKLARGRRKRERAAPPSED
jgi:ribosome-associated protein